MTNVINPKLQFASPTVTNHAELRQDIKQSKPDTINGQSESLKTVADQFEAIFLKMLLEQARDSKLSEGLFENSSDDNFVQMFDDELANSTSKLVDIGIAEAIINQMTAHGFKS